MRLFKAVFAFARSRKPSRRWRPPASVSCSRPAEASYPVEPPSSISPPPVPRSARGVPPPGCRARLSRGKPR